MSATMKRYCGYISKEEEIIVLSKMDLNRKYSSRTRPYVRIENIHTYRINLTSFKRIQEFREIYLPSLSSRLLHIVTKKFFKLRFHFGFSISEHLIFNIQKEIKARYSDLDDVITILGDNR